MLVISKSLLTIMGDYMPHVLTLWIGLGFVFLAWGIFSLFLDIFKLKQIESIAIQARGTNHNQKIQLRGEVVEWIDKHGSQRMKRWVYTVHNSALAGGLTDASALTDTIWSQERERFRFFKYLCRYAVMIGLLFTSAGLCLTLMSVGPALQASGLDPDAWMRAVQQAMAGALGGMSTAFYSSLYAILTALILNLLGLLTLFPLHDHYLSRMDAFIQGTLVPIFTSIVEKDRNDVITEVMERVEHSLVAIQNQYTETLTHFKAQQDSLNTTSLAVNRVAEQLTKDIGGFSTEVRNLSDITRHLSEFSQPIANAIDKGLASIRQAQVTSNEQFASMQHQLFEPFTKAIADQFSRQQIHTQQVFDDMKQVSQQITLLNEQMTLSLKQMTADISQQSEIANESSMLMSTSVESLNKAMQTLVIQQGQNMSEQSQSLISISRDQSELVASLREGVDSISLSKAQMAEKITELFKVHSRAVEKIYEQVQDRLQDVMQDLAQEGLANFHKVYTQGLSESIVTTQDKLTGLQDLFEQLLDTQTQSVKVAKNLAFSLDVNEELVKASFEARRHIIEDLIAKTTEMSSQQLTQHSEAALKNLNTQIETIFNGSLTRQEKLVKDLNEVMSKKWDDLLSATTATVAS